MQKNVFVKIKEIEETKEVQQAKAEASKTPSKMVPNTSGNVVVIGEGSESNRKRFHKDS
jgi:hypothetical protein